MGWIKNLGKKAALAAVVMTLGVGPGWGQEAASAAPSKPVANKYDVSKIGERGIGTGMNLYSLEREIALGKQLAQQVEENTRIIADPVVAEYVNRVGQNIVRNSDAKVPFTIKVIDDDTVNAMALPGGFFYVNSGLILAADNEAELAGVMAHEIAHVAARHATKQATKSQLFNLASIPLIFVGGGAGYAIRQAVAIAVPMSYLKFSRNNEREADLLGLEYQYAAGYDPVAFVEFFEKLQAKEKQHHGFMAKAFSTHPMTEDRVKSAQGEIQKYLPERPQYVVDTSEFDEVKARLSGIINGSRIGGGDETRPTLRRRAPEDETSPQTDKPAETGSDPKDPKTSEEGDRPVLRRRTP